MIVINNQLFLSIKIDNTVLPLGGGQLKEIVITETSNQFLPTIEFNYIDRFGLLFSNPSVYDGKVISVAMATSQHDLESSWKEYIVYPRKVMARTDGFFVSVVGFLNFPDYYIGGSYKSYIGNSSDVARKVASEVGMNSVVDDTNDSQIWLLAGQSRAKFLKSVANHAYSNRNSTYINFVDRNKNLNFIDISKRRSSPIKWIFQAVSKIPDTRIKDNVILVPENELIANFSSDLLNASAGYGIVFRQFDFTSGNETFSTPADYTSFTKYLNVSKDIKGTRFEYYPHNSGNTHKNYVLAKFQNLRNRSLYSINLQLATPTPVLANLFDRVQFLYHDRTKGTSGAVLEGPYFIERIVQTISDSSFVVNYGLVREGINSSETINDLVG